MTVSEKKKKIVALVCSMLDYIDESGHNTELFKSQVGSMSDKDFAKYMQLLKEGKVQLNVEMPNLKSKFDMHRLYAAAKKLGVKIFVRLKKIEPISGKTILTEHEYPVLSLPIRRTQQIIEKKMSLPEGDRTLDALTGQVTGPDQAAALSKEEIQILYNRGLTNTLREMLQVRGGNPELWAEFKQQIEETGEADIDLNSIDVHTRVSQMTGVLLKSMHIDSNL